MQATTTPAVAMIPADSIPAAPHSASNEQEWNDSEALERAGRSRRQSLLEEMKKKGELGEDEFEKDDKQVSRPQRQAPLFHPATGLLNSHAAEMSMWDRVVVFCLVYTAVVTPFEVALLQPKLGPLFIVNRVVDLIFCIDIILTFLMDPEDGVCRTHKDIAIKYLKGWFIIDVLGSFPFDAVEIAQGDGAEGLKFIRILRLARLMKLSRLTRAVRIFERWQDEVAMNYSVLSISQAALGTLLASHWMGCVWYLTAKFSHDEGFSNTWVHEEGSTLTEAHAAENYIAAWYFAVMTMTTIGYGDIGAANSMEQVVASIFMLIGALFYAYIISQVTGSVMSLQAKTTEYHGLMDDLNSFFEEQDICTDTRRMARCFFRMRHNQNTLTSWGHVLELLSPDLRMQLAKEMHSNWATTSKYFNTAPLIFIYKVSALFEVQAFPLGENIFEVGQEVNALYVLTRGTVILGMQLIRAMNSGAAHVLGENELFSRHRFSGLRRSSVVALALTYCTTYTVSYDALLGVLSEFTEVKHHVEKQIRRIALREHVFAYCCAYRIVNGQNPLQKSELEIAMVEHYVKKLQSLKEYAQYADVAVTLQKTWRGYQVRQVKVPQKAEENKKSKQAFKKKTQLTKRPAIYQKDVGSQMNAQVAQLREEMYDLRNELRMDMVREETNALDMKALKADAVEIKAMLLASGMTVPTDAQRALQRQGSQASV